MTKKPSSKINSETSKEDDNFLRDPVWRLSNLYRIVDKQGNSVPFRLNSIQRKLVDGLHTRNLALKARQVGLSTVSVLYFLDAIIFGKDVSAGIVSYSLEHAQHIFKRIIGHALDTLTPWGKSLVDIKQRSAREITLGNGSFLRVDTTLRGGSYQMVLVSEFGKTCARNPLKAEEVVTGTLQAVPTSGKIIIESTAEGNDGFFADMCNQAILRGNDNLSELDYKLFFFPWMDDPSYKIKTPISYDTSMTDYFSEVEEKTGRKISQEQRYWYVHQEGILGEKIKQEFPSTPQESFLASSDAYYYQLLIEQAYNDNRCLTTSLYDSVYPVHAAMDLGINDLTVIVFFQLVHGEIRIIDYYEDQNKSVDFYATHMLQNKRYFYGTIFLPHDAAQRDRSMVDNVFERHFRRLFAGTQARIIVLPKSDVNLGISNVKLKFPRMVFSLNKVKPLIDKLSKYRKKWSEQFGKWLDDPWHDEASHYGDALRYVCQGISHLEAAGDTKGALEKHRKAVAKRAFKI